MDGIVLPLCGRRQGENVMQWTTVMVVLVAMVVVVMVAEVVTVMMTAVVMVR